MSTPPSSPAEPYSCPNCYAVLREKLAHCPHCGASLKHKPAGILWHKIMLVGLLSFMALCIGLVGTCSILFAGFTVEGIFKSNATYDRITGIFWLLWAGLCIWGAVKLGKR